MDSDINQQCYPEGVHDGWRFVHTLLLQFFQIFLEVVVENEEQERNGEQKSDQCIYLKAIVVRNQTWKILLCILISILHNKIKIISFDRVVCSQPYSTHQTQKRQNHNQAWPTLRTIKKKDSQAREELNSSKNSQENCFCSDKLNIERRSKRVKFFSIGIGLLCESD